MSSPRCAAPTWSALVSAQATSQQRPSSTDGAPRRARAEARSSGRASPPARGRRRETSSAGPRSWSTIVAAVEHQLAGDQRGHLAGGDPGEQGRLLVVVAEQQEGRARDSRRQQGSRREVAAQLLEDHGRLDERGPEAVVLLRDGERRDADLLAERLPQRLVVPGLRLHRGAHGRAVAALVQQRARRSRRARPAPRCGRSASVEPRPARPRSGPGGTTSRPMRRPARAPG